MRAHLHYNYEGGTWHISDEGETGETSGPVYDIPDEVIERYAEAERALDNASDEIKKIALSQGFKHWAMT